MTFLTTDDSRIEKKNRDFLLLGDDIKTTRCHESRGRQKPAQLRSIALP